jgi:parallel beta-helix repeat protein
MNSSFFTLLFLSVFSFQFSAFSQGSLAPPGAPAPTMKTLDQIRSTGIALNTTNTPGDASYEFVITQAGSYYLTSNLNVTKPNGIHVTVAGVTVDLNGFQISRSSGASGGGITIDSTAHHCTVGNGSITAFADGIRVAALGGFARGCAFRDLSMSGCTSSGIIAGDGAVLDSCRVHDNSGGFGVGSINAGAGSTLRNCTANNNTAGTYAILASGACSLINCTAVNNAVQHAISAGAGSTLTNCLANFNTGDQAISDGFITGQGCTLTNCVAYQNVSTAGASTGTTGAGFILANGCQIRGCTAQFNGGDGFHLSAGATTGERSTITDCTAANNGGDGIKTGVGSTITLCTSSRNAAHGIDASTNAVIKDCTLFENDGDGIKAVDNSVIQSCAARANQGNGITVATACLIADCVANLSGKKTAPNNTASDGIELGARNRVVNCTVFSNAQHGINGVSSSNRNFIEGCLAHSNDSFGIALQANGNTVIKNQVGGNTGGTINQSGGGVAPLNNASDPVGTIHPLANFQ